MPAVEPLRGPTPAYTSSSVLQLLGEGLRSPLAAHLVPAFRSPRGAASRPSAAGLVARVCDGCDAYNMYNQRLKKHTFANDRFPSCCSNTYNNKMTKGAFKFYASQHVSPISPETTKLTRGIAQRCPRPPFMSCDKRWRLISVP